MLPGPRATFPRAFSVSEALLAQLPERRLHGPCRAAALPARGAARLPFPRSFFLDEASHQFCRRDRNGDEHVVIDDGVAAFFVELGDKFSDGGPLRQHMREWRWRKEQARVVDE